MALEDLKIDIPFGVEIEVNSFDSKSKPDDCSAGGLPLGIYDVATLVNDSSKDRVFVSRWCNNHNNNYWAVKPDSSCGMEICSPILRGWFGTKKVSDLIRCLGRDKRIRSDLRCSFHVHFDASGFTDTDLLSVICWWIKLESFFMDTVPVKRKVNPYCKLISHSEIIYDVSQPYDLKYLMEKLGTSKYYTLNTFHYYNKKRKSIEFRIMDNFCCLDPDCSTYWVALLCHFIKCSILYGLPSCSKEGDPFSGYRWLEPIDAFKFLNLYSHDLPPKLALTRSWLIQRLVRYGNDYMDFGVFSRPFKKDFYKEICKLEKLFQQV